LGWGEAGRTRRLEVVAGIIVGALGCKSRKLEVLSAWSRFEEVGDGDCWIFFLFFEDLETEVGESPFSCEILASSSVRFRLAILE